MGQALDERGNMLGEAFGNSKREVFDKLQAAHPNAAELRIRSVIQKENRPGGMGEPGDCCATRRPLVNESLDTLAARIESLQDTAGELYKRLEPVMRNEPSPGESGKNAPAQPCALAESIDALTARVWATNGLLRDALTHLEI